MIKNQHNFHKIVLWIFQAIILVSLYSIVTDGCESDNAQQEAASPRVPLAKLPPASESFSLAGVGELVKKAKSPQDLERMLNDPNVGVNNLDLNADGKVDYIQVAEWQDGATRGFVLATSPAAGEVQELARIAVVKAGESSAKIEVQGNEQVYGPDTVVQTVAQAPSSGGGWGGFWMGYLFSSVINRPMYASPWGYGSYPNSYRSYPTDRSEDYRRRTQRYDGWSRVGRAEVPGRDNTRYSGKSASSVKAPLKQPTRAQRSFRTKEVSAQRQSMQNRGRGFGRRNDSSGSVRGGGFGRRSSSSRSFGRSGGWGK